MQAKRITVFAGHYGSGKTSLALSYAFWLKQQQNRVALCDLDIVNPYFRTADAKEKLQNSGIRLITSPYANTNVESPALPAETQAILDDTGVYAVVDLGGDERGALALGRYAKALRAEGCEMLLVVNPFRPLTRTIPALSEVVEEIEAAAKVPFTGLVNNPNLGKETSGADVLESLPFAKEAAAALKLPLVTTAVYRPLLEAGGPWLEKLKNECEIFPVDLFEKPGWKIEWKPNGI